MNRFADNPVIALGITDTGKVLTYDERLYEFRLDRMPGDYSSIREMDNRAAISWFYLEHRDWFRKLDPDMLDHARRRALSDTGGDIYEGMSAEERVRADALRDDSVLAGKMIDADPALVHAVVQAIEDEGLLNATRPSASSGNPLAKANLPKGMEALSQMERIHGDDRKMTRAEKLLMKRILKNDDKEKLKRERRAERHPERAQADHASEDAPDTEISVDEDAPADNSSNKKASSPKRLFGRGSSKDGKGQSKSRTNDAKARRQEKSQMRTVPGMKEASAPKGLGSVLSALTGSGKGEGGGSPQ